MRSLKLFWMAIALIGLAGFASEARAKETNATTYNKTENKQVARRVRTRRISYRIPRRARENNRTRIITARGTATRNGLNTNENFQTIVAPNHIANTISSHPTFAVYFPEATTKEYIVTLEEKGSKFSKVVWEQSLKVNRAGIKTIALPTNKPGLEAGKEYRFSVKQVVNPNDRSQDVVAQVWLQKVELSPEIKAQINKASDPNERAIALAENGIWYDSIALLTNNKNSAARELLANLLEQVGLDEVQKAASLS